MREAIVKARTWHPELNLAGWPGGHCLRVPKEQEARNHQLVVSLNPPQERLVALCLLSLRDPDAVASGLPLESGY
jgi:hypothetical protein